MCILFYFLQVQSINQNKLNHTLIKHSPYDESNFTSIHMFSSLDIEKSSLIFSFKKGTLAPPGVGVIAI